METPNVERYMELCDNMVSTRKAIKYLREIPKTNELAFAAIVECRELYTSLRKQAIEVYTVMDEGEMDYVSCLGPDYRF